MAMNRKTNAAGIALIKRFEGCQYKAYKCPAGIWTIGYGSTFYANGKPVKQGDLITPAQAEELFTAVLAKFEAGVNSLVKSDVNENQFSALVSFAFNVGLDIDTDTKAEGLGDSTLLKLVNENPNNPKIAGQFALWISKGTPAEAGLLKRRVAESNLYFTKV